MTIDNFTQILCTPYNQKVYFKAKFASYKPTVQKKKEYSSIFEEKIVVVRSAFLILFNR